MENLGENLNIFLKIAKRKEKLIRFSGKLKYEKLS